MPCKKQISILLPRLPNGSGGKKAKIQFCVCVCFCVYCHLKLASNWLKGDILAVSLKILESPSGVRIMVDNCIGILKMSVCCYFQRTHENVPSFFLAMLPVTRLSDTAIVQHVEEGPPPPKNEEKKS